MLISVLEKVFYFFGSDRRHLLLQDQVSEQTGREQHPNKTLGSDPQDFPCVFFLCKFGNPVIYFFKSDFFQQPNIIEIGTHFPFCSLISEENCTYNESLRTGAELYPLRLNKIKKV